MIFVLFVCAVFLVFWKCFLIWLQIAGSAPAGALWVGGVSARWSFCFILWPLHRSSISNIQRAQKYSAVMYKACLTWWVEGLSAEGGRQPAYHQQWWLINSFIRSFIQFMNHKVEEARIFPDKVVDYRPWCPTWWVVGGVSARGKTAMVKFINHFIDSMIHWFIDFICFPIQLQITGPASTGAWWMKTACC